MGMPASVGCVLHKRGNQLVVRECAYTFDSGVGAITISAGLCEFAVHGITPEDARKLADQIYLAADRMDVAIMAMATPAPQDQEVKIDGE